MLYLIWIAGITLGCSLAVAYGIAWERHTASDPTPSKGNFVVKFFQWLMTGRTLGGK